MKDSLGNKRNLEPPTLQQEILKSLGSNYKVTYNLDKNGDME